jgi:hypothetical protein
MLFVLLLFLFQFLLFLWVQLGFLLVFPAAFIFLATIAHEISPFLMLFPLCFRLEVSLMLQFYFGFFCRRDQIRAGNAHTRVRRAGTGQVLPGF